MSVNAIFKISSPSEFEQTALKIFKMQFEQNPVYRSFCDLLFIHPSEVKTIEQIPFLPIEFFKTSRIISSFAEPQKIFNSSGTTGSVTSKHYVADISIYEESYLNGFKYFYGNIEEYVILALLPSYLERTGSSLIYMVDDLIKKTQNPESGFYLDQIDRLAEKLNNLDAKGQKTILLGVSFALLDFVEKHGFSLANAIIMETGGMKGRRKEIIREELHGILKQGFGVSTIHSEYGMTELLSQAYSAGNGIFKCPSWMKVLTRDPMDPLTLIQNQTGGINIIDLANINSCSFLATQDLGKVYQDGSFEIIGRFDNGDIRGCNLMVL